MIPATDLDTKLHDKEVEMLEVKKTTILGVAETNNTYVIQIDKTVLWIFIFIINYPMLSEFVKWIYRLSNS